MYDQEDPLESMNQCGIYFIATEQYEKAVACFGDALDAVKIFLKEGKLTAVGSFGRSSTPAFCRFLKDRKSTAFENSVFRNPLLIPENPCSKDQVSFIIIYNLALAHHLNASSHRNNSEKLERVLRLWELVYDLHWQSNLGLQTIHTCAILNNLGHVNQLLGDMERCRKCFESLLSIIVRVTDEVGGRERSFLHYNENQSFFLNVAQLILQDSMAAPAA